MDQENKQKNKLKSETLVRVCDLGQSLLRIHNRLIMEGYKISDGKIISPDDKKDYNVNIEPKCN